MLAKEYAPYEEQTFEEQMKNLGIEVIKTAPKIKWYDAYRERSGLGKNISVRARTIGIGRDAIKIMGLQAGNRVEIGIVQIKGKTCMAIKPKVKHGHKISSNGRSHWTGTEKLIKWLAGQGINQGIYKLGEIKGGFLATKI